MDSGQLRARLAATEVLLMQHKAAVYDQSAIQQQAQAQIAQHNEQIKQLAAFAEDIRAQLKAAEADEAAKAAALAAPQAAPE